jgi:ubiquinone/menaquinone biosynthesis C-methylase UbiE
MNYYDAIAKGYNRLYEEEQLRKFCNLKTLLPKDGLILDLGCGTGFITKGLGNAVGIDSSIEMLKLAPKKIRVICADISDLPFKDESFDCVFSLTVLQDVDNLESAINEIKRVLKQDGQFILSVLDKKKSGIIRDLLKKHFGKIDGIKNHNDIAFIGKK